MKTPVSVITALLRSWPLPIGPIVQRRMQAGRRWDNLSAVALVFIATTVQAASEPEVDVIGCVQDIGGQPYRNVHVELSGLNYKGGAGYTGNNSVGTTNERGEFSVRMKAGAPAKSGVTEKPAIARISGKYEVYVARGWGGGGSWGGADVWPKITVSNTGKQVDLRSKGCIRFPYPIDVSGVVTSDDLEVTPYPTLTLRISAVGDNLKMTTYIPSGSGNQDFNFGVDLRVGDAYRIDVPEQPQCARCDFVTLAGEKVGESKLTLLPGSYNAWSAKMLRIHCKRKPPQANGDCKAADDLTEALPRKGKSSGAEMFQQAINQAEQEEREREIREARERARLAAETKRPRAATTLAAQTYSSGVRGVPVAECHRQANASDRGDKLNALPRNDNVLLLRGSIANLDWLIRLYTQCLPDQETQQVINGWKIQRDGALKTCRAISSLDNCLDSPFTTTANATAIEPGETGAVVQDMCRWDENGKCIGRQTGCDCDIQSQLKRRDGGRSRFNQ